jgi:hypothetical protein
MLLAVLFVLVILGVAWGIYRVRRSSIMNRFLAVLFVLVVLGIGWGFYRGWFELTTGQQDQKTEITLTVDSEKILNDKDQAVESLQNLLGKAKAEVKTETNKAKDDQTPRP